MLNLLSNVIALSPLDDVSGIESMSNVLAMVMNLVVAVGFSVTMITLAYSMVQYVLSGGDPKLTKKAWNTFIWSVIAAVVTLSSFAIKQIFARGIGVADPEILNAVPSI